MHPVVRAIGKMLRVVGISSPEDCEANAGSKPGPEIAAEPPLWRNAAKMPPVDGDDSVSG